jgi:hypothetical protein
VTAAKAKGMFVSSVRESGNPTPVSSAPKTPLLKPSPLKAGVPTYLGLTIAKSILAVYAALLYLLGVIVLIAGLWAYARTPTGSDFGMRPDPILIFAPAVAVLAAGGLMHGLSAGLAALRDIAINSFKN